MIYIYIIYIYDNIYIHTYIYAGELFLVPLFCLTKSQERYHIKNKIILTAARSKSRVRNRPTGELETIPPQRPFFFDLEVVLFLTLEVVLFQTLVSLSVFPYLGLIGPFFGHQKTIIDVHVGRSVVLFLALANVELFLLIT